MNDIDPHARSMYADGFDGIQVAEVIIATNIAALIWVQNGRLNDPASYPNYPAEALPHTAARMITSQLLNAGWRPPDSDSLCAPDDLRGA